MPELEPSAPVLSATDLAAIVARDMPGFVLAPSEIMREGPGLKVQAAADAVAPQIDSATPLVGPETIAVRVVPKRAPDGPYTVPQRPDGAY